MYKKDSLRVRVLEWTNAAIFTVMFGLLMFDFLTKGLSGMNSPITPILAFSGIVVWGFLQSARLDDARRPVKTQVLIRSLRGFDWLATVYIDPLTMVPSAPVEQDGLFLQPTVAGDYLSTSLLGAPYYVPARTPNASGTYDVTMLGAKYIATR